MRGKGGKKKLTDKSGKGRLQLLGVCITTEWYGSQTWIQKRKKGTEEEQASLSNSFNRATLAQRLEKTSSQNTVLASWTFDSAESYFWCTRQTKIIIIKGRKKQQHANHHNLSTSKRREEHNARLSLNSWGNLYIYNLGLWNNVFYLTDSLKRKLYKTTNTDCVCRILLRILFFFNTTVVFQVY